MIIVSSGVSACPEILTSPLFTKASRPPKNYKSVSPLPPPPSPLLYEQAPTKFWRTGLPPLKFTLIQKSEHSFFKETKYVISNNEIRTHLNVEI